VRTLTGLFSLFVAFIIGMLVFCCVFTLILALFVSLGVTLWFLMERFLKFSRDLELIFDDFHL